MRAMALRAWHTGWLLAVLCTGAAAGGGVPSAGSGPAASAPAGNLATLAGITAEHQRQRRLCERLAVAAVRAECLRQADRSRDQALERLRSRPPAVSGSSAHSG